MLGVANHQACGAAVVGCDWPDDRGRGYRRSDQTSPAELGVDPSIRLEILKVAEPPQRESGVKVEDVADLVDKLRNTAKVI